MKDEPNSLLIGDMLEISASDLEVSFQYYSKLSTRTLSLLPRTDCTGFEKNQVSKFASIH